MKRTIALLAFFIFVSLKIQAQTQNSSTENIKQDFVIRDSAFYFSDANFYGTYQIIHHTKEREIFALDIYQEIEARRHDEDVVLWKVSPMTTIRIFPRNLIYPPTNFRINPVEIVDIHEDYKTEFNK